MVHDTDESVARAADTIPANEAWQMLKAEAPRVAERIDLPDGPSGCWLWWVRRNERPDRADRVARYIFYLVHLVDPGMELDRRCGDPKCVSPYCLRVQMPEPPPPRPRPKRRNTYGWLWVRNPERRKKHRQVMLELGRDPTWLRQNADHQLEAQNRPEVRARLSQAQLKRLEDPAERERIRLAIDRGVRRRKLGQQVAKKMYRRRPVHTRKPVRVGDALDGPRTQRPLQLLVPDELWGKAQRKIGRRLGFYPAARLPGHEDS